MDFTRFLGDSAGKASNKIIANAAGDFVEKTVCKLMNDDKEEDKGGDNKEDSGGLVGGLLSLGKDKEESGGLGSLLSLGKDKEESGGLGDLLSLGKDKEDSGGGFNIGNFAETLMK